MYDLLFSQILRVISNFIVTMKIVCVYPARNENFSVECECYSSIFDVKSIVAAKCECEVEVIRLVYLGKILEDPFSVDYYKIKDGSRIYVSCAKQRSPGKAKATVLIDRLCEAVYALLFSRSSDQRELVRCISELLSSPVLKSYARINNESQKLIEEVGFILNNSDDLILNESAEIVARTNDMAFTQLEGTREGMDFLTTIYLEDEEQEFLRKYSQVIIPRTNLDYVPKISTLPMPDLGNHGLAMFCDPERETKDVSEQCLYIMRDFNTRLIRVLKGRFESESGFNRNIDGVGETAILEAMNEANGNISKAVRILRSKFSTV